MAKKAKSNLRGKLITLVVILAAIQVAIIFYMNSLDTPATTTANVVDSAVAKANTPNEDRKQLLKVQIAVTTYMSAHDGQPPTQLASLVPDYLSSIPSNPDGSSLKYRVDGKRYFIGDQTATTDSKSGSGKKGAPSSGEPTTNNISQDQKDELIAVLNAEPDTRNGHYESTGKRDPFKPLKIASDTGFNSGKTPLEKYPLEKLSYSAYLQTDGDPKAMIENPDGHGYPVTKGTKVGQNNGVVTDIFPDRIVVVESSTDFTGAVQNKTFEFAIGVKGTKSTR